MAEKFIERLVDEDIVAESDVVKLQYGIKVAKSETVKIALLIIMFQMMGCLKPFFFLMLLSMPLRICTGGVHIRSSLGCFALSFMIYGAELMVLPKLSISESAYQMILFGSVVCILLMPPTPSVKRPIRSTKKYILNKSLSCLLCIFWFFMLLLGMKNIYFIHCGIWALFIQAVQIIIANGINQLKQKGGTPWVKI